MLCSLFTVMGQQATPVVSDKYRMHVDKVFLAISVNIIHIMFMGG